MRRPGLAPTVAALALLAVAPGQPAARAGDASPVRIEIAFTGDVSGYLEPCG